MYKRWVSRGHAKFFYMKVTLEFEDNGDLSVEDITFKSIIMEALQTMFGQVGKSITVDVLKYNKDSRCALLRVAGSGLVKLWSSLTICGQYAGQDCAFRVHQVSSDLMSMAVSSRVQFSPPMTYRLECPR